MRYKRINSCGNGLQTFIDQLNSLNFLNLTEDDIKKNILNRMKTCINDRLHEQQKFVNKDKSYQDHLNIIKIYYDFYVKIEKYFTLLNILISSGEAKIIKQEANGSFNHSVALELKKEFIQFTDISQDTSYLSNLDFTKKFDFDHNLKLLNQNIPDWLENDKIKFFIKYINNIIEEKQQDEERRKQQEEEERRKQEEKLAEQYKRYMLSKLKK